MGYIPVSQVPVAGRKMNQKQLINREYVYSVVVYLTRLGEMIIFSPRLENYQFSQPR